MIFSLEIFSNLSRWWGFYLSTKSSHLYRWILLSKCNSNGKKIDTIIFLRDDDKEFSVTEVSGPPMKNDWALFKGDRMKITKMLKSLMNQFTELNPSSDITLV